MTYLNLTIVFSLSGLWHGAAWTFVIWGIWHGLFLVIERAFLGRWLKRIPLMLRVGYQYLVVLIGWVFFRADDFSMATKYLSRMFGADPDKMETPTFDFDPGFVTFLLIGLIFSFIVLLPVGKRWDKFFFSSDYSDRQHFALFVGSLGLFILSVSYVATTDFNPSSIFAFLAIRRSKDIKKHLLIAGLILILYPMIELVTPMNISGGVSKKTLVNTLEPLNAASFSNSSFQESFAAYVNDQIGFFASLFSCTISWNTVYSATYILEISWQGKRIISFEQPYIDAYYGKDFLGINKIEKYGTTFKALQDSLAVRGKFIMMGMATGKAFFYPEYLPSQKVRDSTNHEYFLEEFKARGINHINFLPMFQKLKERYGDLLFPKYGIHWSHFSNFFVADTLVKYIETQTGWDLPNIQLKALNFSDEPLYYDNDISGSLNLFKEPKPDSMAYPDFQWEPKINKDTKKILIIGDSFGWELVERMRLGQDCFESMEFWYYNLTCYTTDSRLNHSDELLIWFDTAI